MKFKKLVKLICVFAAVFLIFGQAQAEIISNGYTTASGDKFDLVKGVSKSPADLTSNSPTDLYDEVFLFGGIFC